MRRQRGFTLVEAMVGAVVGSLVLAGAYAIWQTHQVEGMRLSRKIDLRNELTLSSKRLQRAVTLAGFGLAGAANLAKDDAVGSDTLTLYSNPGERSASLASPANHPAEAVQVDAPSLFGEGGFVAVVGGGHAELRRVTQLSGSTLHLDSALVNDYPVAGTRVLPARRERFWSDQDSSRFVHETPEGVQIVAPNVKNFQVSFFDKRGRSTDVPSQVRAVRFSLTGIFPARAGAINSIVFSSTAIPRNTL